jgi:hypothetical protein
MASAARCLTPRGSPLPFKAAETARSDACNNTRRTIVETGLRSASGGLFAASGTSEANGDSSVEPFQGAFAGDDVRLLHGMGRAGIGGQNHCNTRTLCKAPSMGPALQESGAGDSTGKRRERFTIGMNVVLLRQPSSCSSTIRTIIARTTVCAARGRASTKRGEHEKNASQGERRRA